MNLVNERCALNNDQHNEKQNDKPDDSHLSTGDQHEGEDQEESNVANRCNRWKDTDHQSKLESGAICMALDIHMMKDKMDMMMNAMKGRVSTNLDELVHHIDSLVMVHVTSCPLLPKFCMP